MSLIKFFERNQVCDFNLWYQGLVRFQIQYGLGTTTGGDSMPNKVIYGAPANSGQREHLDYDQIEFKIRSKTVKETVQNKNVLTI